MLQETLTKSIRIAILFDCGIMESTSAFEAVHLVSATGLFFRMTKKKLILGILAGASLLSTVTIAVVVMSLDGIVKSGFESVGPRMTRTSLTLESVEIQPFSGTGSLRGLLIGNPEGYAAAFAIKMDRARIQIQPASMLSDKIVVETVQLDAPEITFEGGQLENNLGVILKNINEYAGDWENDKPEQKLQINHFSLIGAKVHLRLAIFGGQNMTLVVPDIELRDLGTGPAGVTSAELTRLVITRITREAGAMMTSALAELGRPPSPPKNQ